MSTAERQFPSRFYHSFILFMLLILQVVKSQPARNWPKHSPVMKFPWIIFNLCTTAFRTQDFHTLSQRVFESSRAFVTDCIHETQHLPDFRIVGCLFCWGCGPGGFIEWQPQAHTLAACTMALNWKRVSAHFRFKYDLLPQVDKFNCFRVLFWSKGTVEHEIYRQFCVVFAVMWPLYWSVVWRQSCHYIVVFFFCTFLPSPTVDQDNITDTSSRNGAWAQREELRAVTPANQKDRAAVVQTSV